jgi:hypothetical protein
MRSLCAVTGKRWVIPIFCLVLLSAFLPSIGQSVEMQEPQNIYFYRSDHKNDLYDPPERLMVAWDETKEMPEMSELASYGDYSVLIAFVAYSIDDRGPSHGDYFVLVSTLQSDNEGLVHQLMVRFQRNYDLVNSTHIWSITHTETYIETHSFNPIAAEEGESKVDKFLSGCSDPLWGRDRRLNYPFLVVSRYWIEPLFPVFSVSAILNRLTGHIVVVSEVLEPGCGFPECNYRGILSDNPDINPTSDTLKANFCAIARALPQAYNAKPGDTLWCLYFDTNRDSTIDIYDAITFAKNR